MSSVTAVVRNELRILSGEVEAVILLVAMPLVITALMRDTITASLASTGENIDGAQYAVPGQAVLFGFFMVALIALAFYREHAWKTWERLLASPARPWEIVLGKVLPWIVIAFVQMGVLVLAGWLLMGLEVSGSDLLGMGLVTFGYVLFIAAFALLLVAVTSSMIQVDAVGNLGAIILGVLGGALVPAVLLPEWARAIAPFTPTYWVMEGHVRVLVEDEPWYAVIGPTLIVLAFAGGAAVIAAWRYDPEAARQGLV